MSLSSHEIENEPAAACPAAEPGRAITITMDGGSDAAVAWRKPKQSGWFAGAVVASVVFHVLIAWAGLRFSDDDVLGGADVDIETISVEIISEVPRAAPSSAAVAAAGRAAPPPRPKQPRHERTSVPKRQDPPQGIKAHKMEPAPSRPVAAHSPDSAAMNREPLSRPDEFPLALPRAPHATEPPPSEKEVQKKAARQDDDKPDAVPPVEDFPPRLPKHNQASAKHNPEPKNEKPVKSAETKRQKPTTKKVNTKPEPDQSSPSERTAAASSPKAPAPAIQNRRVTSASKGALRKFARRIARALARSRPRRGAGVGTTIVTFTLSDSGRLEHLTVKKSSGKTRLDRAALRAVRRTRFPKPPPGATHAQRSFVIPYHFRRR